MLRPSRPATSETLRIPLHSASTPHCFSRIVLSPPPLSTTMENIASEEGTTSLIFLHSSSRSSPVRHQLLGSHGHRPLLGRDLPVEPDSTVIQVHNSKDSFFSGQGVSLGVDDVAPLDVQLRSVLFPRSPPCRTSFHLPGVYEVKKSYFRKIPD